MYAKAMLFIDNNQCEVFEIDALLKQRMRTDCETGAAILDCGK